LGLSRRPLDRHVFLSRFLGIQSPTPPCVPFGGDTGFPRRPEPSPSDTYQAETGEQAQFYA
jgi:hypothetical protein